MNYSTRLTLIERVRQADRDEPCWEEFVDSYKNYIYVIIRKFNLSNELCDDMLQDILIQLWKSLPKFDYRPQECRFRTWLSIVCCSVVKNHLKSKAGRKMLKETEYEESLHALDQFSEPEIERIAESEWKNFIAEKALENIRPRLTDKMFLVFEASFEERPDKDVASEIGCSEASVRVYRQRVRNSLMKEIIRLNDELDTC